MAPRFEVLHDEVDRARRELGITDRVRVRITYYRASDLHARYVGHDDGLHRIGVDGDDSARTATKSIWHELGHVRQAQELGGFREFDREWGRQMKEAGITAKQIREGRFPARKYKPVPLEAEAEGIAKERAKDWPLVAKR